MIKRPVALWKNRMIRIESIYTVCDGKQINIEGKVEEIRALGQNKELFCPCRCGKNLILIASDRNLKTQHFRILDGKESEDCTWVPESKNSVDAKVTLKCWLDDKLKTDDVEAEVPICTVEDNSRKYEFTFLSEKKQVALSYCQERTNLSDEKINILEENSQGIHLLYVVDKKNIHNQGQYPEWLMKIQRKQGFCLFLSAKSRDYYSAVLTVAYYEIEENGQWKEYIIEEQLLNEFDINSNGQLTIKDRSLQEMTGQVVNKIRLEKQKREDSYNQLFQKWKEKGIDIRVPEHARRTGI